MGGLLHGRPRGGGGRHSNAAPPSSARDPPRHLIYNERPMPERLWSFNDLARFLRFEDPEVRYWAAERLVRHHTKEATDLLAPYLFDDHDLTPELVASHLGKHG